MGEKICFPFHTDTLAHQYTGRTSSLWETRRAPPDPQKINFYWGRVAGGCFNVVRLRLAFPIRGDILVFVSSGRPGGPKQKKSGLESGCLEYSMRENGKTKEYRILHNLDFFPIRGARRKRRCCSGDPRARTQTKHCMILISETRSETLAKNELTDFYLEKQT